jgi:4-hydroxy-2-oxoheptanedioate aldolase
MGHRGRADHPEVQAAMLRFEAAIRPSPVVLGGVAPTHEQANAMVARGYRALVVGFGWSLAQRGCAAAIEGVSRWRRDAGGLLTLPPRLPRSLAL